LSEKDLPINDAYGAILRKDLYNNISNLQFVIPLKSHNTLLRAKKLLASHETNGIQGMNVSYINVVSGEKQLTGKLLVPTVCHLKLHAECKHYNIGKYSCN
jgi:hypothetical protein